MGNWLEDAITAQFEGHQMTVLASAGMGYEGQGTAVNFNMPGPSGCTIAITVGVEADVTAGVAVTGNNVAPMIGGSGEDYVSLSDENVVIIEIPPAADQVEILFFFNGIGFDPESGPMGSLTFTNIELSDPVIQGDILKFSVNDGVRVLNHQYALYGIGSGSGSGSGEVTNEPTAHNVENYPMYGETVNISSAESGVITKKGKLNLGTN